jgi:hypothetical protein
MYLRAWAGGDWERVRADVRAMHASRERVSACLSIAKALMHMRQNAFDPPPFPGGAFPEEPFPNGWGFEESLHGPIPPAVK